VFARIRRVLLFAGDAPEIRTVRDVLSVHIF
jgi:hypothetical protein